METMKELIRPELLVLIPVLYFTGMDLKKSASVLDKHIPLLCAGWDGCGAVGLAGQRGLCSIPPGFPEADIRPAPVVLPAGPAHAIFLCILH